MKRQYRSIEQIVGIKRAVNAVGMRLTSAMTAEVAAEAIDAVDSGTTDDPST